MSYIKLDRKLKDWEWIRNPNVLAVWIHILLNASYKDYTWQGKEFPKGSFPTSLRKIAEKTGLTIQQTRTAISNIQSTHEITITSTNKYSLITVNKWAEYQSDDECSTHTTTSKPNASQQTNNTQTNNIKRNIRNKEVKNIKKEIYKERNVEFAEAFKRYIEHRKLMKKPMTDYAIERAIKKLEGMGDEKTQIAIINQSIDRGWLGLFALEQKETQPIYDASTNKKLSNDELNELLSLRKVNDERN